MSKVGVCDCCETIKVVRFHSDPDGGEWLCVDCEGMNAGNSITYD